jgi:hypothetical protein
MIADPERSHVGTVIDTAAAAAAAAACLPGVPCQLEARGQDDHC